MTDAMIGMPRPPSPPGFFVMAAFWGKQDSIRSLIVLDNFVSLPEAPQFKEYGRALEWGYPTGVGWRPLDLFQTHYLMNLGGVDATLASYFLGAVLK